MEVTEPTAYLAVGDFLVTRVGDAVELLACGVIELETNESVGVQRSLSPAEARALGAALITAANATSAMNDQSFRTGAAF